MRKKFKKTAKIEKKNKEPRILSLDYETSPQKGYYFGPNWETSILENIEYTTILCVGYKWDDGPVKVVGQNDFKGYKKGVLDDEALVKFFAPILKEADIVSAHNGDQFDVKVFNTRLLKHKLDPIPLNKTFDTKKIAKNMFYFPSNKLDDIADFLDIGRKLNTYKQLWFGCEKGDEKSWKYMKKYCGQDVALQYEVLKRVLPFAKQSGDFVYVNPEGITCPNPLCLSTHMTRSKNKIVKGGIKRQYQCQDCGSYFTNPKLVKEVD
ncbi:MAG: ribonuclease H-like domain-containing protein [Bacilli bacterium]|jgi:DNA polymerase elongation subunit (family B)